MSARDDAHSPGRLPWCLRGAARNVAGADAGDKPGTGRRLDRARAGRGGLGVLAWRALAQSVTLTPDALMIENIDDDEKN